MHYPYAYRYPFDLHNKQDSFIQLRTRTKISRLHAVLVVVIKPGYRMKKLQSCTESLRSTPDYQERDITFQGLGHRYTSYLLCSVASSAASPLSWVVRIVAAAAAPSIRLASVLPPAALAFAPSVAFVFTSSTVVAVIIVPRRRPA